MKQTRNDNIVKKIEEDYYGNKIVALEYHWEECNEKNDKWENKKAFGCSLLRVGKKESLNLCECNDGDKFTSINQAVNQAKEFVNVCNKNGW